jgi:hypothetical protein
MARLTSELSELFIRSRELKEEKRTRLGGLGLIYSGFQVQLKSANTVGTFGRGVQGAHKL